MDYSPRIFTATLVSFGAILSQTLFHGGTHLERHAPVAKLWRSAIGTHLHNLQSRFGAAETGVQPGGLEVALKATLKHHPCVWLGWSGEVKPHPRTRTVTSHGNSYITTDLRPEDFEEYYNGFANRVLWPILHYRLDLAEFSRRDLSGYLRVNEHFADELAKVLKPADIVWVHRLSSHSAGQGAARPRTG